MQLKPMILAVLLIAAQASVLTREAEVQNDPSGSKTLAEDGNVETRPSDIYGGSVQINIADGEQERIAFFGTLVSNQKDCSHSRCYFGWVNNYTITGQETVVGLGNPELKIQPVFEFRVNSEKDFLILRNENLPQEWVQIIEILCEKVNPRNLPERNGEPEEQKANEFSGEGFDFRTVTKEDLSSPEFKNFERNSEFSRLEVGDFIGRRKEDIQVDDLKTSNSFLSELLLLSREKTFKARLLNYQISLESTGDLTEKGEQASNFDGIVDINLNYAERSEVSHESV